jgi:hypothetical protein
VQSLGASSLFAQHATLICKRDPVNAAVKLLLQWFHGSPRRGPVFSNRGKCL